MKTDLIRYNREYLISVRAEAIRSTFDLNSVGHLISRRGTKVYIYIYTKVLLRLHCARMIPLRRSESSRLIATAFSFFSRKKERERERTPSPFPLTFFHLAACHSSRPGIDLAIESRKNERKRGKGEEAKAKRKVKRGRWFPEGNHHYLLFIEEESKEQGAKGRAFKRRGQGK